MPIIWSNLKEIVEKIYAEGEEQAAQYFVQHTKAY